MDFTSMIASLEAWDREAFLFLNGFHAPFWDGFMWLVSSTLVWVPFLLCTLAILFKDKRNEFILISLGLVLTIVLCDQVSASVFKPLVERLRPSREPLLEGLVHLVNGYRGGQFGFVSSHAANVFGFVLFSSLIFRFAPYTIAAFLFAFLNSYSRIYLGVHYPLDVICGALLGMTCALVVYFLLHIVRKHLGYMGRPVFSSDATASGVSYKSMWMLILTLATTLFFIFAVARETIACYS